MDYAETSQSLDSRELAELRFDLQEFFSFIHGELGKTPSTKDLQETLEMDGYSLMAVINQAFDGYNDLVRSMGEIPNSRRTPQDKADYIFRSEVELPMSMYKLEKSRHHDIHGIADEFGNPGLMESLGIFDEYIDKLNGSDKVHMTSEIQNALNRRSRDRESQIINLERKLGKNYREFTTKYETGL